MKEFTTTQRPPLKFTIDGEEFTAASSIPGDMMVQVAKFLESTDMAEQVDVIVTFLDSVLVPESATRFAARFKSAENPITIDVAADVVMYLIEQLQSRPTGPASDSPSQPALSGNGSGAGVSPTLVGLQTS